MSKFVGFKNNENSKKKKLTNDFTIKMNGNKPMKKRYLLSFTRKLMKIYSEPHTMPLCHINYHAPAVLTFECFRVQHYTYKEKSF